MNVSLSGIDFFTLLIQVDFIEMFLMVTIFRNSILCGLPNAAVFDFPVRPHTWVEKQKIQKQPSLIGGFQQIKKILSKICLSPYYY